MATLSGLFTSKVVAGHRGVPETHQVLGYSREQRWPLPVGAQGRTALCKEVTTVPGTEAARGRTGRWENTERALPPASGDLGRLPGGGEAHGQDGRGGGVVRSTGPGRAGHLAGDGMTRAHPLPCTVPPVLEPAEFQNHVAVARGSPVVLPCEARGSPLPLVSWMKDGEPLFVQSLEQGPGLQLETAGAGDSGTYACVAVSEAGEARRRFQLTVMGGSAASWGQWGVWAGLWG